jgi:hypothetical protein
MLKGWFVVVPAIVAVSVVVGAAGAAGGASVVRVTTAQDSGPGSFRAAVARANADPSVTRIEFRLGLGTISLAAPVVFGGKQALDVIGSGATLDGSGLPASAAALFLARGGGNLSVAALTVKNAPQQGLTYQVPPGSTGSRKVVLTAVQILGNKGHGVLVNDQDAPDEAGDPDADPPVPPNPAGSEAALEVWVVGSRIAGNGFGAGDRDGIRVNEGAGGNLKAVISLTKIERNGGDGVELDERGPGDASFNESATQVTANGVLDPADLDDGMDVDESGDGDVVGSVTASSANDNYEEGWDLNENDAGNFEVDMTLVGASRNGEEGIDFEEDDDFAGGGDLVTTLVGIEANGNKGGDAGLKIREKGDGNLEATVRSPVTKDNLAGGISVREDAVGSLTAAIERPTSSGNTGHGTDFDENSDGDLTASAKRGSSTGNGGAGVRADEGGAGTGALELVDMMLTENTGGPIVSNVSVTQT